MQKPRPVNNSSVVSYLIVRYDTIGRDASDTAVAEAVKDGHRRFVVLCPDSLNDLLT